MIFRNKYIIHFLFVILIFYCCERVNYFPDKPIIINKTIFLAHHGAGDKYEANSLRAAKYGINNCKGIECDIQLGKDGSIWLDHSYTIEGCGIINKSIYSELTDTQILYLDSCLGDNFNAFKLDSVFKYISDYGNDKLISLDVKAWEPIGLEKVSLLTQMNRLADNIIYLTNKYNLKGQVMVESETGDFLYYIKENGEGIETYLTTLGDFELGVSRALNANFTGISFKYNYLEAIDVKDIDFIHRKGLKIHLWTLNEIQLIEEAILLKPDYIQTDKIDYVINHNLNFR